MKNSACKGYVYKDSCKDKVPSKCTEENPCKILNSSSQDATNAGTGWTWYQCDCCDSGCDGTSEIKKN